MKIKSVKMWKEHIKLTVPYTISYMTTESVEIFFVTIETECKIGIGAGTPVEKITGESVESCQTILENNLDELLLGKDLRDFKTINRQLLKICYNFPAARAAIDIALHDLIAKCLNIPLVDMLGRVHHSLPTSVTIGIMSSKEAVDSAKEYIAQGFKILKVKTGKNLESDIEVLTKIRETIGYNIKIRIDHNQGYDIDNLKIFCDRTNKLALEFIEQPLPCNHNADMLDLPENIRLQCMADESLQNVSDALNLTMIPRVFGHYNIKLMKCGGINEAIRIADIADIASINLMWGCMDESIISISAAIHSALSCPTTKWLDLDGSFDLAKDIVKGGFILKDGYLTTIDKPGLGVDIL